MCKQFDPQPGKLYTVRSETVGCIPDPPNAVGLINLTVRPYIQSTRHKLIIIDKAGYYRSL